MTLEDPVKDQPWLIGYLTATNTFKGMLTLALGDVKCHEDRVLIRDLIDRLKESEISAANSPLFEAEKEE